jgi:hypothetical protein
MSESGSVSVSVEAQQMKAIRDLSRLRRALTRGIRIETRAITADNFPDAS